MNTTISAFARLARPLSLVAIAFVLMGTAQPPAKNTITEREQAATRKQLEKLASNREDPEFVIWIEGPQFVRMTGPAPTVPVAKQPVPELEIAIWADGVTLNTMRWEEPGERIQVYVLRPEDVKQLRADFAESKLGAIKESLSVFSERPSRYIATRVDARKRRWGWDENLNPHQNQPTPERKAFVSAWFLARLGIGGGNLAKLGAVPVEDICGEEGVFRGYSLSDPAKTPWLRASYWQK